MKTIELDRPEVNLIKLDFFIVSFLVSSLILYYQIRPLWDLTHETALLYSFVMGFGIAMPLVMVLRGYNRKRQKKK